MEEELSPPPHYCRISRLALLSLDTRLLLGFIETTDTRSLVLLVVYPAQVTNRHWGCFVGCVFFDADAWHWFLLEQISPMRGGYRSLVGIVFIYYKHFSHFVKTQFFTTPLPNQTCLERFERCPKADPRNKKRRE